MAITKEQVLDALSNVIEPDLGKDLVTLKMIEDAEKNGILKPGGTIIEGTSGNTGMGLALVALAKGYKCIFTLADKQSQEKIDILRAVGAEVIVCPTNVPPEDPKSYYSVAKKLNKDIPNSFYPNQYDNTSNATAHYETTGPEIWEQTEGQITHYGRKICDIYGCYMGYMDFNGQRYFDIRHNDDVYYPIILNGESALESDSTKRIDSLTLASGDLDAAQKRKEEMEEL